MVFVWNFASQKKTLHLHLNSFDAVDAQGPKAHYEVLEILLAVENAVDSLQNVLIVIYNKNYNMGDYEKFLGMAVVPFLYVLLVLLAIGIARKQLHAFVRWLLSFNLVVNGYTLYIFPLLAGINLVAILGLYYQLSEMTEPAEMQQKTQYFEKLYRTYRNFLLNIISVVLILQIFIAGRAYQKYEVVRDKLEAKKKAR